MAFFQCLYFYLILLAHIISFHFKINKKLSHSEEGVKNDVYQVLNVLDTPLISEKEKVANKIE